MVSLSRRLAASTLISTLCLASALTVSPAQAGSKQQTLVDRATLAVQDIFQGTTPSSRAQRYLANTRGHGLPLGLSHVDRLRRRWRRVSSSLA